MGIYAAKTFEKHLIFPFNHYYPLEHFFATNQSMPGPTSVPRQCPVVDAPYTTNVPLILQKKKEGVGGIDGLLVQLNQVELQPLFL